MSKRKRKRSENFLLDCDDYPRCYGCEYFQTCDLCDDPVCWWKAIAAEDGLYCQKCASIIEAVPDK
jgi:hypothetical protein